MAKKIRKEFGMIEQIAKGIGGASKKSQTILELVGNEEDSNSKILKLKSGKWSGKEPWFIYDEKQKLHALISVESLAKLVESFKKMEQEAFVNRLERSILQHLPIDFQDVWTVAMVEVQKQNRADIDLEKLLLKIKKEHPNLFLNLKDLYIPEGVNFMQQFEESDR